MVRCDKLMISAENNGPSEAARSFRKFEALAGLPTPTLAAANDNRDGDLLLSTLFYGIYTSNIRNLSDLAHSLLVFRQKAYTYLIHVMAPSATVDLVGEKSPIGGSDTTLTKKSAEIVKLWQENIRGGFAVFPVRRSVELCEMYTSLTQDFRLLLRALRDTLSRMLMERSILTSSRNLL
jgi:hypothetical protein